MFLPSQSVLSVVGFLTEEALGVMGATIYWETNLVLRLVECPVSAGLYD